MANNSPLVWNFGQLFVESAARIKTSHQRTKGLLDGGGGEEGLVREGQLRLGPKKMTGAKLVCILELLPASGMPR